MHASPATFSALPATTTSGGLILKVGPARPLLSVPSTRSARGETGEIRRTRRFCLARCRQREPMHPKFRRALYVSRCPGDRYFFPTIPALPLWTDHRTIVDHWPAFFRGSASHCIVAFGTCSLLTRPRCRRWPFTSTIGFYRRRDTEPLAAGEGTKNKSNDDGSRLEP